MTVEDLTTANRLLKNIQLVGTWWNRWKEVKQSPSTYTLVRNGLLNSALDIVPAKTLQQVADIMEQALCDTHQHCLDIFATLGTDGRSIDDILKEFPEE